MRRLLILPALLFLLVASCKEEAKKLTLKTFNDSLSYAIGTNIATSIERDKIDSLNIDALATAMRDYNVKDTSTMTKAEMASVMKSFSMEHQKKMQEEQMKQQKEKEAKDRIAFKDEIAAGEKFLKENAAKSDVKTTASGLQYKVIKEGKGAIPKATDKVKVHYKGTLLNGTVFDSSYDRGESAVFGVNRVIKGWTEALQLMKVGAKYELYIPYEIGYGVGGAGEKIPPFSNLIFEVELISIESK